MPFAIVALARAVWWFAGADSWNGDMEAFFAFAIGSPFGCMIAGFMAADGIKWNVTIGKGVSK